MMALMSHRYERYDRSDMGLLDRFRSIRSIKKGLQLQPADMDIRKLYPMFAPASFFQSGRWPGPYILPGAEGVGLTWALELPAASMRYLDQSMRAHWEADGVDWKAVALANLDEISKE